MPTGDALPPWTVLLIGGHSGAGKTTVAYDLARRSGAACTQVDDIRLALQQVITPAERPALHFFLATPDVWRRPPAELCAGLIAVGELVSAALDIVIAHHLATARPLILEGDGIVPALAAQSSFGGVEHGDRVRAVFLVEPDVAVVQAGMLSRGRGYDDRSAAEQAAQARMNRLYGRWLHQEAERMGLPVLPSRPWPTLADRIIAAIG